MRESYFSLELFALRFCNFLKKLYSSNLQKNPPTWVFCKYFFPCQTKSYFYLTIKALAKMLFTDISSQATIWSYD